MQWWCSATGFPWTWTWQWYPGVHLLLLLLALAWWQLGRWQRWPERPWRWFAMAWLTLLITLDWPIGKLGAGYLASVHTLQFLLLTLSAGPSLIKSVPPVGWLAFAPAGSRRQRFLRTMGRPLPGLLCYTALVITTHFPAVVDGAMTSQLGSLSIDLAWLTAGLVLWWPIVAPRGLGSLGIFGTIGYIFGATITPTIPAMMMVFSDWPIYQLYEQTPRVWVHFSANTDLKLAGLSMKVFGDIPLWGTAIAVFFRGTNAQGEMVNT
jgi:cytochrome c oxidase assembly factor CtaG